VTKAGAWSSVSTRDRVRRGACDGTIWRLPTIVASGGRGAVGANGVRNGVEDWNRFSMKPELITILANGKTEEVCFAVLCGGLCQ